LSTIRVLLRLPSSLSRVQSPGGSSMHAVDGRRGQAGQGIAEYALILGMIAIIATVILLFLSGKLLAVLSAIGSNL
jgi:Flp pilus assembly pilin Flp